MNCLTQRCAHEGHLFFLLLGLCHSSELDKALQLLKQRVIKVLTFDHHAVVEIKEPLCIGSWLCSTVLLLLLCWPPGLLPLRWEDWAIAAKQSRALWKLVSRRDLCVNALGPAII